MEDNMNKSQEYHFYYKDRMVLVIESSRCPVRLCEKIEISIRDDWMTLSVHQIEITLEGHVKVTLISLD